MKSGVVIVLDLTLEIITSISDLKEVPGPDEAANGHPEEELVSTGCDGQVQKDVVLVVLVIVVQTFILFIIGILIDPVDQWFGSITEREASNDNDNTEDHKDGVGLEGVCPHEWRLVANSGLNLSVSILELYPNVRSERDSENEG